MNNYKSHNAYSIMGKHHNKMEMKIENERYEIEVLRHLFQQKSLFCLFYPTLLTFSLLYITLLHPTPSHILPMAPSDSDNTKITPLNGHNYQEWRRQVQAVLMEIHAWKLVTRKELRSTSGAEEQKAWDMLEEKAAAKIYLRLDELGQQQVEDVMEDPVKMWDVLEHM